MKNLTIVNPASKVTHTIKFKERPSSPGKIVITLDGRNVGKINIASKLVFCDKPEIYEAVTKNVDEIIAEIKKSHGSTQD